MVFYSWPFVDTAKRYFGLRVQIGLLITWAQIKKKKKKSKKEEEANPNNIRR